VTLFTLRLPEPCPERMTRKDSANALTLAGFKTTPKSIADWPLDWIMINGRQTADTRALFAEAQRRIDNEYERLLNKRGRAAARGLRGVA